MKLLAACLFVGATSIVGAQASGAAASAQDVIHTKTGLEISGILTRAGANLTVRFQSPTGAQITQQVPVANVDRIDFAGADKVEAELAKYDAATLPMLLQKWRARRDWIDIPESPSGAYGICAARLLLESGSPQAASAAREILDLILAKDWDSAHRDRARTLVIESLRRTGKHAEALKAAHEFLATDATPESKAEVNYYLALALIDDYRAFLAENPRWEADPYMRPKRDLLYNEVLDCLLAPYLRYGAPPEATAQSLLAATNFLEEFGEHNEAAALAQDIVKIFPAQPEAAQAKKFLEAN